MNDICLKKNRNKIFQFIDVVTKKIENYIMSLGLLSISVIVFITVIARYFFNTSFPWAEELSRYIVVWVTFFGVSSCSRYSTHVRVDLISNRLENKAKRIYNLIITFFSAIACIYLAIISIRFTYVQKLGGNTSIAIAIPVWIIYLAPCIGFFLSSYVYIKKFLISLFDKIEETE